MLKKNLKNISGPSSRSRRVRLPRELRREPKPRSGSESVKSYRQLKTSKCDLRRSALRKKSEWRMNSNAS